MPGNSEMPLDTMKLLAEAAAQQVAASFREELREERHEFRESIKAEIEQQFKKHFGEMEPSKHVIQHDRLEKMLVFIDGISKHFWGRVIGNFLLVVVVLCILLELAWLKLFN